MGSGLHRLSSNIFHPGPELGIFLEPLKLDKKDLVVLAVNDNSSSEHAGGSHW